MPDHDKLHQWPEHDKLREVADRSQAIGEFLEWLDLERDLVIARYAHELDEFVPANVSTNRLLAEFFGIDLDKLEAEKRDMLTLMKEAHDDS